MDNLTCAQLPVLALVLAPNPAGARCGPPPDSYNTILFHGRSSSMMMWVLYSTAEPGWDPHCCRQKANNALANKHVHTPSPEPSTAGSSEYLQKVHQHVHIHDTRLFLPTDSIHTPSLIHVCNLQGIIVALDRCLIRGVSGQSREGVPELQVIQEVLLHCL